MDCLSCVRLSVCSHANYLCVQHKLSNGEFLFEDIHTAMCYLLIVVSHRRKKHVFSTFIIR